MFSTMYVSKRLRVLDRLGFSTMYRIAMAYP